MKKKIAYGVTGLILGCIFLFPIYILIMNSFKTTKGIFTDVLGFPAKETFTLENYKNAFSRTGLHKIFCEFAAYHGSDSGSGAVDIGYGGLGTCTL